MESQPGDEPLILDLVDARASMVSLAGGKAANLGELISAGLPVPGGFCITTEAYRRVAEIAELSEVLGELAGVPVEDGAAVARLAERARAVVRAAPVPAEVLAAVTDAYRRLGRQVPVAVRSSATAEDLPFASFAGQQDTFLNVVGFEAVVGAMRRCWASLWTDRAVQYRDAGGIDDGQVRIAVVVQHMVDAVVAG